MFGGLGNLGNLFNLAMNLQSRIKTLTEELSQEEISVCVSDGDELSGLKSVKITANGLGENVNVSLPDEYCTPEKKAELEALTGEALAKMSLEIRALFMQKMSGMAQEAGISGFDGLMGAGN